MADLVCLHAKAEVERLCRARPLLHLYSIGDLDDFFWPHTVWYSLRDGGELREFVLLYTGCSMPTVLALTGESAGPMRDLLRALLPLLPRRFYAHLTSGLTDVLAADYRIESHGDFHKMGLTDPSRLSDVDVSQAVALTTADTADLQALYDASYPGNWFVPRMLETGRYFGVRRSGALVGVAGVHVYSRQYRAAALGNVTTHPDHRGRGLATALTARLCRQLLDDGIEHVGLNVKADNRAAVSCYERLGCTRVADYGEFTLELR